MKNMFFLVILASTVAMAQGHRRGGEMQGGKFYGRGRMIEELKLSNDQKKEFEKLRTAQEKNAISTRSKIQLGRVDLRQLYSDDVPDRAKIEEKTREIAKLETDLNLARTGFWFDVNKMLTPEQKTVWKKMPMMMGDRRGPGMWNMCGNRRMMMRGDREDDTSEENDD